MRSSDILLLTTVLTHLGLLVRLKHDTRSPHGAARSSEGRRSEQAQRGRKTQISFKGTATRAYNKVLKRSRRYGNERVAAKTKKECATAFWKFASKILDSKANPVVNPTFAVQDTEQSFSDTSNSSPLNFSLPPWLPTPTEPQDHFECDAIRTDEVISVSQSFL